MYENPQKRARLRQRLEGAEPGRKPITINDGLELLSIIERQDYMIDWLIGKITDFCLVYGACIACPCYYVCPKDSSVFKDGWHEAARKAVEGMANAQASQN